MGEDLLDITMEDSTTTTHTTPNKTQTQITISSSFPTPPVTPTFIVPQHDITNPDNNFLRSPHQPSPQIKRSYAQRVEDMEEIERERDNHASGIINDHGVHHKQTLLSTSEDIFVIPPTLSIDEKLFQDEVILWSHYVKISTTLQQPQSIFNFVFFSFFFVTTIVLAVCANNYLTGRASIVTLWLMSPIVLFSGFALYKLLMEHTCFFITNYRVIQCKLLGARVTAKSMSYASITDIKTGPNSLSFYSRRGHPFIKLIGLESVSTVSKILQQQRDNPSRIGPLDSPQALDIKYIPEKFSELVRAIDLPFLEVNHPPSFTAQYLRGTIRFIVVYLWTSVLLLLTRAPTTWIFLFFFSILLLPVAFMLTNTLDKVDVLGTRNLVFLRVGLAYIRKCHFGRNVLRLGYENAYPLVSNYNIKNNKGTILFYNFTFASLCSEDVIVSEEIIFHKHLDALTSQL